MLSCHYFGCEPLRADPSTDNAATMSSGACKRLTVLKRQVTNVNFSGAGQGAGAGASEAHSSVSPSPTGAPVAGDKIDPSVLPPLAATSPDTDDNSGEDSGLVGSGAGVPLPSGLTFRFMGHEGRTLTPAADELLASLAARNVHDVVVSAPPLKLEPRYRRVFTPDAVAFVASMCRTFDGQISEMLRRREEKDAQLAGNVLPGFLPHTTHIKRGSWKISPLPARLMDRRVDIGDVATHDARALLAALNSGAQGVQADFDDGHCPTWERTILGLDNVIQACLGKLTYTDQETGEVVSMKRDSDSAVMMSRPRAWNMRERHMMVAGREVLGAMVDFALIMFHAGQSMHTRGVGPFFYLSKVETHQEARLWNDIFTWTEQRLELPRGCIKGCVLIENVLASFEAEEILYELRTHSAGLNCGMWDYAASFIAKFRHRPEFVLPDRSVYVNMDAHFMRAYRDNVIRICHRRGAPATGGMSPVARPGSDLRFPNLPITRRDIDM